MAATGQLDAKPSIAPAPLPLDYGIGADINHEPGRRELTWMFAAAVALRLAVFMTVLAVLHVSVKDFADKADGKSYLRYAQVMCGEKPAELRDYDMRVFPGYPALIALLHHAGLPVEWAALGISWLAAGAAVVFGALLFRDRRIGWGMVMLTPQYLLNGGMVMTESLLLALLVGGLYFAIRGRTAWTAIVFGGILAGAAGVVRPMACFGVLGVIAYEFVRRRGWRGLAFGAVAAAVVLAAMLVMHLLWGDALQSAHIYSNDKSAYNGELFTWPFKSLVTTVLFTQPRPRLWKIAYILPHVPLVLAACAIVLWRWRNDCKEPEPLAALCGPWLLGNTLFVLCVGSVWGFAVFQRLILVALPPMLWAFQPLLPKKPLGWWALGAISFAIAVCLFKGI
ncbi:MAG TPA: hypothetical protein VIL86_18695 [Tepidisphaeraceae bacterium]|jgi:hypothetical protein